jgi:hypothetical protein
MHSPGSHQLRKRHNSKSRMTSPQFKLFRPQLHTAQIIHISGSQLSKLVQQVAHCFPPDQRHVPRTVKRVERPALSAFQHHPRPRHPIHAFAVNQMPHDIKRTPGVLPFIPESPSIRQPAQQRVQNRRRPAQQRNRFLKVVSHGLSSFAYSQPGIEQDSATKPFAPRQPIDPSRPARFLSGRLQNISDLVVHVLTLNVEIQSLAKTWDPIYRRGASTLRLQQPQQNQ